MSTEQKAALRSELRERLADGERVGFVVAEQAVKYSITPNTVRWHLKRLDHAAISRRARRLRAKSRGPDSIDRRLVADLKHLIKKSFELSREYMEGAKRINEAQLELTDVLAKAIGNPGSLPNDLGDSTPAPALPGSRGRYEPFGPFVKALRKAAGLTLDVVATRLGTHKGYISGIENRTVAPPSPKFVARFAQLYSVDGKDLLRRAEVEKLPAEIRDEVLRVFWPPDAPPPAPSTA